ncbi:MAG: DUF413 domain-containing protein [Bacteroidia bacterium]
MNAQIVSFVEYDNEKVKHKKYLSQIEFQIRGGHKIFNADELLILTEKGTWLEALYLENIKPITLVQAEFVSCMYNKVAPVNKIANIFYRYINRLALEQNNSTKLNLNYEWEEQEFLSREGRNYLRRSYTTF